MEGIQVRLKWSMQVGWKKVLRVPLSTRKNSTLKCVLFRSPLIIHLFDLTKFFSLVMDSTEIFSRNTILKYNQTFCYFSWLHFSSPESTAHSSSIVTSKHEKRMFSYSYALNDLLFCVLNLYYAAQFVFKIESAYYTYYSLLLRVKIHQIY